MEQKAEPNVPPLYFHPTFPPQRQEILIEIRQLVTFPTTELVIHDDVEVCIV